MNVLRVLVLVVLGLAAGGFGLCGAWGVLAGLQEFADGCRGSYTCITWYFGWIGLAVAAVGVLLFWAVRRFWPIRPRLRGPQP